MLNVMVIDDSRTVHNFLRLYLSRAKPPCEVESVMDGADAVTLFQQGPRAAPDVIFLDWEMPRLNGPDTFERLRALGVRAPVIMLTSRNDVGDIERMLTAGVDEYAMKPFTADIIYEKLSTVLGQEVGPDGA